MKRSSFTSFLLSAALMVGAVFIAFASPVVHAVYATCRALKNLALDGFKLAANDKAEKQRTVLPFIQAKAFKARKDKRERPELTGSWRMCPST